MTRLLAIDIGNTSTKFAVMRGHELEFGSRVPTDPQATAADLVSALKSLRPGRGKHIDFQAAAICSVVPSLNAAMAGAVRSRWGLEAVVLEASTNRVMKTKYRNPRQLGMDRLANACAASRLCGAPCIVVDFGTATKIEAVDAAGVHLGGAIMPGLGMMVDALDRGTALLPSIPVRRPGSPIGRSTVESIRSGTYFGAVEAARGCIARFKEALRIDGPVVGTGGHLGMVLGDLPEIDLADPHLTLRGIALLAGAG